MSNPDTLREACDNIDKLIQLELEKIETMRKMKKALALAILVPEVLKAKTKTHVVEGSSAFQPWRGASLFVTVDGMSYPRVFDLVKDKVPDCLWPEHLLQSYKLHQKRLARQPRV